MLHEERDRRKFVSDVQYLRDMQHKADSEYQACLRRQEYRRDPNDKKQYQFWEQESSGEEEPLTEPKSSPKVSTVKCDSRLPAIDQTPVKQKHKSTMTPRKPEKAGPSKAPATAQTPKILPRKRRPNLGRLTVNPDMRSATAPGDGSEQKSQLPTKVPALRGPDPVVHRESQVWAGGTTVKRPTQERRCLVPTSQLMATPENPLERAKRGDPSAVAQNKPQPALSQAFQGTKSPQVLGESLRPSLIPSATRGPRRTPFRFRDEDFYSVLSPNAARDPYDTEEETHEEELPLLGLHPPRSPSSHRRSRCLGTSASLSKNKHFSNSAENHKGNSLRRREPSPGLLRTLSAMEPEAGQPSLGQRMLPDPWLPSGESATENDSDSSENKKTFRSWDSKSESRQDDSLRVENVSSDSVSMDDKPDTHDHERDWQDYLNSSRHSLDFSLAGRPTVPRSSLNSPCNTARSSTHHLRVDVPVDLSMSPTLVRRSDTEGNARFNVRQPLSPIRNRIPLASARESDVRGAEDVTSASQAQEAPSSVENPLPSLPDSLPLLHSPISSPSRVSFQDHLHLPGSLQENIHFALSTVSYFLNQSQNRTRMAASGRADEEEAPKIQVDPEKLRKLQESLLEEDEEEEGDLCRICQMAGSSPANPLLQPCGCVGSLRFVHQECLKQWLKVKITSGANREAVNTCEMCKHDLLVDLAAFNMTEFYQKHQQIRAQNELINSSFYLVLLLYFYEQRFAEIMTLNYDWITRDRIPSWGRRAKAASLQAAWSSEGAGRGLGRCPLRRSPPCIPALCPLPPPLFTAARCAVTLSTSRKVSAAPATSLVTHSTDRGAGGLPCCRTPSPGAPGAQAPW
ncbi:probable E3 ubiquitin-protein ligase MARCHF10 isoform X3 [Oryctolagus cuniculus]|uniref:probable E3 ubiquitin-protein ligase MARCHF10 isoform X3 n=1 Tax=Oryctolagus cuniculus TaxID=9986 RepID=UPI0038793A23